MRAMALGAPISIDMHAELFDEGLAPVRVGQTGRRSWRPSRSSQIAAPEEKAADERGCHAECDEYRVGRPVDRDGGSGCHLAEDGGIEEPVVRTHERADEIDEERPDEHAVDSDARRARVSAECEHSDTENKQCGRNEVQPGGEQAGKADPRRAGSRYRTT